MGGIAASMQVAEMAQAHHLPVSSHGVHDLHVHLLAASPNAIYLEVHGFGLERFVAHPIRIENGEAVAPDRPGHGVEFNWQALAEHEVRPQRQGKRHDYIGAKKAISTICCLC